MNDLLRDKMADTLRNAGKVGTYENVADAIIAALPGMVHPLVWFTSPDGGTKYANSIKGRYAVWDGYYRPPHTIGGTEALDPESAAQAHYVAAIMQAFVVQGWET